MSQADAPLNLDRILATAEEVIRRFGPAKATVADVARALTGRSPRFCTIRASTPWFERVWASLSASPRVSSMRPPLYLELPGRGLSWTIPITGFLPDLMTETSSLMRFAPSPPPPS